MVDERRLAFTRARVKQLIRDKKAGAQLPPWGDKLRIKGEKLYWEDKEIVPSEDVTKWLRDRVYSGKAINLSRDSGYTDYVARESMGVSRRAWHSFLKGQDTHQRLAARPKNAKLRGQKIKIKGHTQADLIEVKAVDVPSRKKDTYIMVLIDRLTSYTEALRVDTKQVSPKGRGTLTVMKELMTRMEKALDTKVKILETDAGGEFLGAMIPWLKSKGITKEILPVCHACEARNGFLQRKLYSLIMMGEKGGFDALLSKALRIVNNTTSGIHGLRPVDAAKAPAAEIEKKFNDARQRPGKRLLPKLKKGDLVMVLDKHADKKSGKFYKSYRDHWSVPKRLTAIRGGGYKVDGKSYPRARIKRVQEVDKQSLAIVQQRTTRKRPTLAERVAAAKSRKEKREMERKHYLAQPRRSSRAAVKKVHTK